MKAIVTKVAGDLRRRKLQSLVIALVILLSSGAATLALSLLVESDAPYDHAFAQANGAHLTLTFAADRVSTAQLRATASAHGVTAAVGPWPEAIAQLSVTGSASAAQRSGENTSYLLLQGVIAGLALILTAIAVAGVFNTVVLSTREKVRDVAILKAVGMAPRQVVAMVVASVAVLGLIAGGLGIPVGLALHREILQSMGQIATGTAIPPGFFDLISHAVLPLLALAGVAIAALGTWVPAQWAASSSVAEVLQAE